MSYAQSSNLPPRSNQLNRALGLAVALHILLAILLPGIPQLVIPAIERGSTIKVFLRKASEPEAFQQSLNNPGEISTQPPDEVRPLAGLPTDPAGKQETISDTAPPVESEQQDQFESNPAGEDTSTDVQATVLITRSMISLFAQREAFEAAERDPQALQRFNRSFSSYASYRQRPTAQEYRDLYGDYYVRPSASDGDICFVQQRNQPNDDFSTNTVYFFRCDREPLRLNIDASR